VLPPGSRRCEIEYTALTFLGPERVQFRYQLEGLDPDWVHAGTRRTTYLTTLPPGAYTYRVTACNAAGVYSEEGASLTLIQRPHFYETVLFYTACIVGLILLMVAFFAIRLRAAARREQELLAAVEDRTRELRELADELKDLTLIDPLTGLRNRRYLFETITPVMEELEERRAAQRAGEAGRTTDRADEGMGVLILDLDHFKDVNDAWGHDAGDLVLQNVAHLLRDCVRPTDIAVRWGGEEFLVVLPRTQKLFLTQLAERIRARMAAFPFRLPDGPRLEQTCSVGVVGYPFFEKAEVDVSLNQLISLADMALYRAKEEGRNRVIHIQPGDRPPLQEDDLRRIFADPAWAESAGYLACS
jgi:diguanylate cyclase (GGDEF)-like protein